MFDTSAIQITESGSHYVSPLKIDMMSYPARKGGIE